MYEFNDRCRDASLKLLSMIFDKPSHSCLLSSKNSGLQLRGIVLINQHATFSANLVMIMPDDYPNQGNVDVEGAEEGVHPHHNLLGHCVGGGYIAAKLEEDPVIHHQDKLNKSVKTKHKGVF